MLLIVCLLAGEARFAEASPVSLPTPLAGLLADPSTFEAPLDYASLEAVHRGSGGPLLVHVQDAHANFSGQQNLASALDDVMGKYGISLVLSEGGWGDCSLTPIKSIASEAVWKKVAHRFLVTGKIQGEEYLNLVSGRPMKIVGIEDEALYEKSVTAYRELTEARDKALGRVRRIRDAAERLEQNLFPDALLRYQKAKSASGSGETDVEALLRLATEAAFDLSGYPELEKLSKLKVREDALRFDLANLEHAVLVEELVARGAEPKLADAAAKGNISQRNKASQLSYYQNTFKIAKEKNFDFSKYVNLAEYVSYLKAFNAIDLSAALEESSRAEDALYVQQLNSEDARLVRAIDRFMALLESAHRIQMTARQYAEFKLNEPDMGESRYLAFLNRKLAEQGLYGWVPSDDVLAEGRRALDEFYDLVALRDEVFITNLKKATAIEKAQAAFLITGGYHTPNLRRLMSENGFSYVVLMPGVEQETNQEKYESLLLSESSKAQKKVRVVAGESKAHDKALGALDDDLAKLIKKDKQTLRMLSSVAQARRDAGLSPMTPMTLDAVPAGSRLAEIVEAANPNAGDEELRLKTAQPVKAVDGEASQGARLAQEPALTRAFAVATAFAERLSGLLSFSSSPMLVRLLPAAAVQTRAGYTINSDLGAGYLRVKDPGEFETSVEESTWTDVFGDGTGEKYSAREAVMAALRFLQEKKGSNMAAMASELLGREIGVDQLLPQADLMLVKTGAVEFVFQLVLRVESQSEPVLIALHFPRDSQAAQIMAEDAQNQKRLNGIREGILPKFLLYADKDASNRPVLPVFANQWIDGALEGHFNSVLNGDRFILWNFERGERRDVEIKDPAESSAMAKQIFRILAFYNEIDLSQVIVNAGDFVFRRTKSGYEASWITVRNLLSGPRIRYNADNGTVVWGEADAFLTQLLTFKAHDEIGGSEGEIRVSAAGLRFASYSTVLEGFVEGVLARLAADGMDRANAAAEMTLFLDRYAASLPRSRSAELRDHAAEIADSITELKAGARFAAGQSGDMDRFKVWDYETLLASGIDRDRLNAQIEKLHSFANTRFGIHELTVSGASTRILMDDAQKVAGFAVLHFNLTDTAKLAYFAVREDVRSQGLGKALFYEALHSFYEYARLRGSDARYLQWSHDIRGTQETADPPQVVFYDHRIQELQDAGVGVRRKSDPAPWYDSFVFWNRPRQRTVTLDMRTIRAGSLPEPSFGAKPIASAGARLADDPRRRDMERREMVRQLAMDIKQSAIFEDRIGYLRASLVEYGGLTSKDRETLQELLERIERFHPLVYMLDAVRVGHRMVVFNQQQVKALNDYLGPLKNDEVIEHRQKTLTRLLTEEELIAGDRQRLLKDYKQDLYAIDSGASGTAETQEKIGKVSRALTAEMNRYLVDEFPEQMARYEKDAGRPFDFVSSVGLGSQVREVTTEGIEQAFLDALQSAKMARLEQESGERKSLEGYMREAEQLAARLRIRGEVDNGSLEPQTIENMLAVRGLTEAQVKATQPNLANLKRFLILIDLLDFPKPWTHSVGEEAQMAHIQRVVRDLRTGLTSGDIDPQKLLGQINEAQSLLKKSLKESRLVSLENFHIQATLNYEGGAIISMDAVGFYAKTLLGLMQAFFRYRSSQAIDAGLLGRDRMRHEAVAADDAVKDMMRDVIDTFLDPDFERESGLDIPRVNMGNGAEARLGLKEGGDEVVLFSTRPPQTEEQFTRLALAAKRLGLRISVSNSPRLRERSGEVYAAAFTEFAHTHGMQFMSMEALDKALKELVKKEPDATTGVLFHDRNGGEAPYLFYFLDTDNQMVRRELNLDNTDKAAARLALEDEGKLRALRDMVLEEIEYRMIPGDRYEPLGGSKFDEMTYRGIGLLFGAKDDVRMLRSIRAKLSQLISSRSNKYLLHRDSIRLLRALQKATTLTINKNGQFLELIASASPLDSEGRFQDTSAQWKLAQLEAVLGDLASSGARLAERTAQQKTFHAWVNAHKVNLVVATDLRRTLAELNGKPAEAGRGERSFYPGVKEGIEKNLKLGRYFIVSSDPHETVESVLAANNFVVRGERSKAVTSEARNLVWVSRSGIDMTYYSEEEDAFVVQNLDPGVLARDVETVHQILKDVTAEFDLAQRFSFKEGWNHKGGIGPGFIETRSTPDQDTGYTFAYLPAGRLTGDQKNDFAGNYRLLMAQIVARINVELRHRRVSYVEATIGGDTTIDIGPRHVHKGWALNRILEFFYQRNSPKIVFIGDKLIVGGNDAMAMERADVGIHVGPERTSLAIPTADGQMMVSEKTAREGGTAEYLDLIADARVGARLAGAAPRPATVLETAQILARLKTQIDEPSRTAISVANRIAANMARWGWRPIRTGAIFNEVYTKLNASVRGKPKQMVDASIRSWIHTDRPPQNRVKGEERLHEHPAGSLIALAVTALDAAEQRTAGESSDFQTALSGAIQSYNRRLGYFPRGPFPDRRALLSEPWLFSFSVSAYVRDEAEVERLTGNLRYLPGELKYWAVALHLVQLGAHFKEYVENFMKSDKVDADMAEVLMDFAVEEMLGENAIPQTPAIERAMKIGWVRAALPYWKHVPAFQKYSPDIRERLAAWVDEISALEAEVEAPIGLIEMEFGTELLNVELDVPVDQVLADPYTAENQSRLQALYKTLVSRSTRMEGIDSLTGKATLAARERLQFRYRDLASAIRGSDGARLANMGERVTRTITLAQQYEQAKQILNGAVRSPIGWDLKELERRFDLTDAQGKPTGQNLIRAIRLGLADAMPRVQELVKGMTNAFDDPDLIVTELIGSISHLNNPDTGELYRNAIRGPNRDWSWDVDLVLRLPGDWPGAVTDETGKQIGDILLPAIERYLEGNNVKISPILESFDDLVVVSPYRFDHLYIGSQRGLESFWNKVRADTSLQRENILRYYADLHFNARSDFSKETLRGEQSSDKQGLLKILKRINLLAVWMNDLNTRREAFSLMERLIAGPESIEFERGIRADTGRLLEHLRPIYTPDQARRFSRAFGEDLYSEDVTWPVYIKNQKGPAAAQSVEEFLMETDGRRVVLQIAEIPGREAYDAIVGNNKLTEYFDVSKIPYFHVTLKAEPTPDFEGTKERIKELRKFLEARFEMETFIVRRQGHNLVLQFAQDASGRWWQQRGAGLNGARLASSFFSSPANARAYADAWGRASKAEERNRERLLELAPEEGTFLDVGTGTGKDANFFHFRNRVTVGVDSEPAMLAVARTRYPHVPFIQASMTSMREISTGSAAAVYANASLNFLNEDQADRAFDEFRRVLGSEGILFLRVIDSSDGSRPSSDEYGKAYTATELARLVEEHGFQVIEQVRRVAEINPEIPADGVPWIDLFARKQGSRLPETVNTPLAQRLRAPSLDKMATAEPFAGLPAPTMAALAVAVTPQGAAVWPNLPVYSTVYGRLAAGVIENEAQAHAVLADLETLDLLALGYIKHKNETLESSYSFLVAGGNANASVSFRENDGQIFAQVLRFGTRGREVLADENITERVRQLRSGQTAGVSTSLAAARDSKRIDSASILSSVETSLDKAAEFKRTIAKGLEVESAALAQSPIVINTEAFLVSFLDTAAFGEGDTNLLQAIAPQLAQIETGITPLSARENVKNETFSVIGNNAEVYGSYARKPAVPGDREVIYHFTTTARGDIRAKFDAALRNAGFSDVERSKILAKFSVTIVPEVVVDRRKAAYAVANLKAMMTTNRVVARVNPDKIGEVDPLIVSFLYDMIPSLKTDSAIGERLGWAGVLLRLHEYKEEFRADYLFLAIRLTTVRVDEMLTLIGKAITAVGSAA